MGDDNAAGMIRQSTAWLMALATNLIESISNPESDSSKMAIFGFERQ
jgi:hypothetical protein